MLKRSVFVGSVLALTLLAGQLPAFCQGTLDDAKRLENSGQWHQAKDVYEELYQKDSQDYLALINFARLTSWDKDYDKSLELYKKAYAIASNDQERYWAQLGQAEVLGWQKDYLEAKRIYNGLIMQRPGDPEPRYLAARTEAFWGRTRKAKKLYRENIRLFPNHTPSRLGLAELLSWKGDFREAEDIYEEVIADNPDNIEAWVGLGHTQTWWGRLNRGNDTLHEARHLFPDNRDVLAAYLENTAYFGRPDQDILDMAHQGDHREDKLTQVADDVEDELKPYIQSGFTRYTENGTLDEKVSFSRPDVKVGFHPNASSELYATFNPTYYASGANLEREERYEYGLGGSYQWTNWLGTSSWVGLSNFSNDGSDQVYTRTSIDFWPTDYWQPSIRFDRYPVEAFSIMSATGVRPVTGLFANMLVGRVSRNQWSLENHFVLPYDWYADVAFRIGVDTGKQMDSNTFWKLESFIGRDFYRTIAKSWKSTWYGGLDSRIWHFEDDRNSFGQGFLVVKAFGLPLGSDTVSPLQTATNPGVGGYFSPDHWWYEALKLGNRGTFWNKRVTYDASAFIGFQDIRGIGQTGTDAAGGVAVNGEIELVDDLAMLFSFLYANNQNFDYNVFYVGLRKRF